MISIRRVLLFLALLLALADATTGPDLEVENLSDEEVIAGIESRVEDLTEAERYELAKAVYDASRVSLFMEITKIRQLPAARVFIESPPSNFKYWLTANILKSDSLWSKPLVSGASGVGMSSTI